jgi:hypothetical protein
MATRLSGYEKGVPRGCPLLALSGHPQLHRTCPLLGVKRTSRADARMSAFVDIDHDLAVSVLRLELVEGRCIVAEREARIDNGAQLPTGEPHALSNAGY